VRFRAELALLALLVWLGPAWPEDAERPASAVSSPAPIGSYLSRAEILAAAAKLRADPNLSGNETTRTLRWNPDKGKAAKAPPTPRWLAATFDFLAQSSSLLLWIAGIVCAGIAGVFIIRLLKRRMPRIAPIEPRVLSVRGLDIRPESLPDDVGAAALGLLDAGREREALSLLYRGALSRAVHRHGVAIGPSATEGEALRAVNATLDPGGAAYFTDLVAIWQRAVYAGEKVVREPIARLCSSFRASLEAAPA
jgi:Domain of unknown function (DUF4129)